MILSLTSQDGGRTLTPPERALWLGQQLDPESPLYNMAVSVELDGELDIERLRRALERVVAETEALRTTILQERGEPCAVVVPDMSLELHVVRVDPGSWANGVVGDLVEERVRRPFDLARAMTDIALFVGGGRSLLYIGQHHLVTDAISIGLLYRMLSNAYEVSTDAVAADPTTAPQYSAYAESLAMRGQSAVYQRSAQYWEDSRAVSAEPAAFYGGRPDGAGYTDRIRLSLGEERAGRLAELITRPEFRALSEHHARFLVFSTVLSAWASRAMDRQHVSIGVPSHNRTSPDLRATLGLFVELYPLRMEVDSGDSLRTLAKKVAEGSLNMMRHAVPGAGGAPAASDFNVVLNYITAGFGDFAGRPGRIDWVHSGRGDPAHAIRLQIHDFENTGVPTLDFDLDRSVFGEVERAWVVEHFFRIFDAVSKDPDRVIAELPLCSWEEEAEFAPRGAPVEASGGVLSSFARQLRERPDTVAVTTGAESWTYAELGARAQAVSNAIGPHLAGGGEEIVAVLLDRGIDQLAAILGVLRAGAAYMPLDPTHPDERIGFQLGDADACVVLTSVETVDRVRALGSEPVVVPVTRRPESFVGGAGDLPPLTEFDGVDPPEDALAYLLYTSGSTGQPKGVEVTHRALGDYLSWTCRMYDRGERLRWAWFTSSAYDLTVTSVLGPLVAGGSIVVFPDLENGGGLVVREVLSDDRVQAVKLTPSHLELVRDLDLSRSGLRRLIVGGENFRSGLARAVSDALPADTEIYNEYGPTEATVACMIHRYEPARDLGPSVPIGVPADNMRIHVLGPSGAPVLRGETGEVCISGPRVARGYRGRPERTAQVFVDDPLGSDGRMYRTGDLGRWMPHGALDFEGREDDQVKVGGVRVELGEVETALLGHPEIGEVAARLVGSDQLHGDRRCRRCGLEARHPESRIEDGGLCQLCVRFANEQDEVARYFGSLEDLEALLRDARERSSGPHDCLVLCSGGKDSTYALCRVVELGANPLVFLLDNGFISDQAKENVRRVTDLLDLELVIGTTPAMPGIFAESLERFANVCQGCFKTVYTLALTLAVERGIGAIVTGLSRGQIFETRLADLYRRRIYDPEAVDRTIDEARRAYHRMDDAIAPLLDVGDLTVDDVLDRVTFIDFYRYTDVELDELLTYVGERTPWIRPSDTGRSTNCLINEAGIFVHLSERGFHNYSLPYSWDVRLGHKERDAAVEELDDNLDRANIRRMLDEVGYRERPSAASDTRLVAYYVAPEEVPTEALRTFAAERLPLAVVPSAFVRLDALPLTGHGKVDRNALPVPGVERPQIGTPFVEPTTPTQWLLAEIWGEVLGLGSVGIHDDFFDLGGESMRCIQIASIARERGLAFAPRDLFRHPTIAQLSGVVEDAGASEELVAAEVSADELESLVEEFGG